MKVSTPTMINILRSLTDSNSFFVLLVDTTEHVRLSRIQNSIACSTDWYSKHASKFGFERQHSRATSTRSRSPGKGRSEKEVVRIPEIERRFPQLELTEKAAASRCLQPRAGLSLANFGKMLLVFGCIGSDFCKKYAFCSIFQNLPDSQAEIFEI